MSSTMDIENGTAEGDIGIEKDSKQPAAAQSAINKRIDDRLKRINLKSKRLRNLMKKGIELSQMCDLDIVIVIRDREMEKITQYCSGPDDQLFSIEEAQRVLENEEMNGRNVKIFNDRDYNALKTKPKIRKSNARDDDDVK